jgi:hypothetical protein
MMKIRNLLLVAILICVPQMIEAANIDAKLWMPNNIVATAGQTVTVPINLSNIQSSFTLDSFQLIVSYDSTFFDVPVTSGFKLGTLTTGLSYSGTDNIDTGASSLNILRTNVSNPASLTSASSGSLMTFEIKVKAGAAAGSSGYLNFVATQGAANTEIVTLTGDDIRFNPVLSNSSIQGLVSIAAVPEPSTYALAVIAMTTLTGTWYSKRRKV